MGSITKRKNKKGNFSYLARIRRTGFPHKLVTFYRRTDAEAYILQEERKIRAGTFIDDFQARTHTLKDAIDRLLHEEDISAEHKTHLKRWEQSLGPYFLSSIKITSILEAIHYWKEELNLGPATLNRHLDALSLVFRKANELGWLIENPVMSIKRFKEPKGRVRYLSGDERERLLTACKASNYPNLYLIVVLTLSTGMRKEEVLSLRWNQIDVKKGIMILTRTKNNEYRRVHVRGLAFTLLLQLASSAHQDADLLFPASDGGRPRKADRSDSHFDIKKPWRKALKEAGINNFVFHDLRHSCASYLAMNGATPIEIAEVLGHKSLDMVKRYAHLSDSHTRKVVERMNRIIFGNDQRVR